MRMVRPRRPAGRDIDGERCMYCTSCGTENDDGARFCKSCGGVTEPPARVPNYLVQAVLMTIFCCLPFGIVSIVYAAQVNGRIASGDVQGAMQSSERAKLWAWVSFGIGIAIYAIFAILPALSLISGNY